MATYLAFRIASILAPLLPAGWGYRLAEWLGDATYYAQTNARARVARHIRRALGDQFNDAAVPRLVRAAFRNRAKNYFDLLRMPRLSVGDLANLVRVSGWHNLDTALARGRGVVLISIHLGSFEIVMQKLATRGYDITVPAEPIKPDYLYEFVNGLRSTHGVKLLPSEMGVARKLIAVLRRNGIVGLAVDRDVRGDGVPMPLFGATAKFQPGAAALARRFGCPIVPAFCTRKTDNTSEAFILPAMDLQITEDEAADLQANMGSIVSLFEGYIKQYPDQWMAFEPIWEDEEAPCARR